MIKPEVIKAKEYLKNKDLSDEKSVKLVFREALESYLRGKISSSLFSSISNEILYEHINKKDIYCPSLDLQNALEAGSELDYYHSKYKNLARIEDRLKEYYSKFK